MSEYKIRFESKPIAAIQTVAELLRFAREQQGKTIADAAQDLQIASYYLEALENGDYAQLPCLVYSRNFVRNYGHWLGLHTPPLLKLFSQEWNVFEKHQRGEIETPREGIDRSHFWQMPRWIRWAGSAVLISGIFGYFGHGLYQLRQPPELTVYSPNEEVITDRQVIDIAGQSEPETELSINNQTILSDVTGNFKETIALQPGLNVIEIRAKKKHSRENTVFRKIIVTDQPVVTTIDQKHEFPVS